MLRPTGMRRATRSIRAVERTRSPVARARVRWGLPDVAIAWVVGIVGSAMALPLADPDVSTAKQPVEFIVAAVLLQNLAIAATLWAFSRFKGQGSLRRDFGLDWPLRTMRARLVAGWLALGVVLQFAASILLLPINRIADLDESAQEVGRVVERANGLELVLILAGVVVVAPVVEELLFRGALLRALQRRFSIAAAVFTSAAIFAGVHVLGDPGSYPYLPAWLLLGLVSGWAAARTGNLSRSILLHMGFNLIAAVLLAVG